MTHIREEEEEVYLWGLILRRTWRKRLKETPGTQGQVPTLYSRLILDLMRFLVNRWFRLTFTSRPAAAALIIISGFGIYGAAVVPDSRSLMRWRVSPAMHLKVFLRQMPFLAYTAFYWAESGGISYWPGWLTVVLQRYDAVGWVIWPVKSYQKWPTMCRVWLDLPQPSLPICGLWDWMFASLHECSKLIERLVSGFSTHWQTDDVKRKTDLRSMQLKKRGKNVNRKLRRPCSRTAQPSPLPPLLLQRQLHRLQQPSEKVPLYAINCWWSYKP